MRRLLLILVLLLTSFTAWSQKPGTTPIKVSFETQMLHGRKYFVHVVEKGQTVYSIAKAYRVQSFDAITHVDIHALHPGDTVWLPFRGQFTDDEMQTKPTTPAPVLAKTTTRVDTVYVRDTTYIKVPYAVHDTTIVTDTVTLTKYVTVHDTTVVTNTKTQTEYVPKYDTIVVTDTVTLTKYETVRDTTYIKVPYAVHDTTVVTDTVTLTKYVTVHDTTVVTNTMTQKEYVPKHDTTYITVHDTTYIKVPYAVHDTTVVTNTMTQTEYVPKHDTTYITVHDTTYINVPYAVHDTIIVTNTMTQTEYVPKHDTTYITVRDTTIVTDTVRLTEYVTVHDTTYVVDTVDYTSAPALAFASASAVALTENVPANQPVATPDNSATPEPQRREGKTLKVALMMPLHLNQIDEISTSKFDVEQRGKKSYKQFEFIEFYEGIRLAIDQLSQQGIAVEVNVVDVSDNTPAAVESAFLSHNVAKCDMLVALLFRDCFNRAAQLAQQAGIYIINPMATRSDICAENPYVVKIQPSLSGMVSLMLSNMKFERPDGHLYIIHSGSKEERAMMEELKRQLTERGDIKYTLFNWSQSARLATELKKTPACNVLSIYDQGKDNNHVYLQNLLNRLASIKKDSPTLYSFTDWTREYGDVDFVQLQQLGYHTFSLAWDMTNDVHVQFLREFRSQFGSEPTSQLAATGYDLMLYIGSGLQRRRNDFWTSPTLTMPTLIQPLHLSRSGAGLENDKAQLYRLDDLRFVKALFK